MRWQRNSFKIKKQDKTKQEKLSEVKKEIYPMKSSGTIIVKIIRELRKRIDAHGEKLQEVFNKELENIKNNQSWKIQ